MPQLAHFSKYVLALVATTVLFVIGIGMPSLGIMLLMFVPHPGLILGVRYGMASGVAIFLAAWFLVMLIAGKDAGGIYAVFGVMGSLLLSLLGRIRTVEYLVAGTATAVFAMAVGLVFVFFGSWSALLSDLRESVTHHFDSALKIHEKMGFPQESLQLLKDDAPKIIDSMLQILPGLVLLSLAFVVLVNLLFLCKRFPQRRGEWLSNQHLTEWKCPEPLVWLLIAAGFAMFMPGLGALRGLALNLLLVIGACYFAQGIAVIAFFFHKNNVPRFLRAVTYVLIVFQQIFTLLVVGLGLFDLWGNFRRLGKDQLTPSQAS